MRNVGHPTLYWIMENIHIHTDPARGIKPDKERSTEKIDGEVATITALDCAIQNEKKDSLYDERGIIML